MSNRKIEIAARLALLLATIIWGSTFFIMESTIEKIGIFTLLGTRFSIAAILLAVILFKRLKTIDRNSILYGLIMGILVITAFIVQTYGLADINTTPGKNAFLTAIYCILVPFLFWIVSRVKPDRYNIIAALLCLFGITLISLGGDDFSKICIGDLLTLLGGFLYACHMVAVSVFSQKKDILVLTMLQFFFAAIIAWIPALITEGFPPSIHSSAVLPVIYLAVMATCVCYILQNVGQKFTTPSTAALILSLEAVFGVLFSVVFTSEQLTPRLICGFSLIFIAILISELKPKFLGGKK